MTTLETLEALVDLIKAILWITIAVCAVSMCENTQYIREAVEILERKGACVVDCPRDGQDPNRSAETPPR